MKPAQQFLGEGAAALIAGLLLSFTAALVNATLFPFMGGEFHAMFAYSEGYPRAALWAWIGYVGTIAVGAFALTWLGYPTRWWALAGVLSYFALRYWWTVYSWQPQSPSFRLLTTALLVASPLLVFVAAGLARRIGPGRFDPLPRWAARHLGFLLIGVPAALVLLPYMYEVVALPSDESYGFEELFDAAFWTVPSLLFPLLVAGALHLVVVWALIRLRPGLRGRTAFILGGPVLLGILMLWRDGTLLREFQAYAIVALLSLGAYLLMGSSPPAASGAGEPVVGADAARRST